MEKMIEIDDLTFGYDQEEILQGINLKIEEGDFVALVGSNGAGKSTLMKLMVGLLEPRDGQVKIFDKPVGQFRDWSRIGFVSQKVRDFNKSFPATVKEIIGANLHNQMGFFKILTSNLDEKIDKVLELVGMSEYKERQIGTLSGGQQQRVFIARVLVTDPAIIFLDEPLVGVDKETQEEFYQLLADLNQVMAITIVMISHDIELISKQAKRIIELDRNGVIDNV